MDNVTSTLLEQPNENLFDRHDYFFMDYMSFKRLCSVFAIIIPTFIIWELFIFLVYVNKSNQDRFNHCAGPRYFTRCLAYLCMCVGLICYGRYAIHQYSIERYDYYGPMNILSTSNFTEIIQFERYQYLDKYDIRQWSCPYLNGTAPTPRKLNNEEDKIGFGTCNPDVLTGTLQLSWTCSITSDTGESNNGGGIRGSTTTVDGDHSNSISNQETLTTTTPPRPPVAPLFLDE